MATERCRNEDGLPGKEGAELHHFIYGEFFKRKGFMRFT